MNQEFILSEYINILYTPKKHSKSKKTVKLNIRNIIFSQQKKKKKNRSKKCSDINII
jgi:hypothetical protein